MNYLRTIVCWLIINTFQNIVLSFWIFFFFYIHFLLFTFFIHTIKLIVVHIISLVAQSQIFKQQELKWIKQLKKTKKNYKNNKTKPIRLSILSLSLLCPQCSPGPQGNRARPVSAMGAIRWWGNRQCPQFSIAQQINKFVTELFKFLFLVNFWMTAKEREWKVRQV